MWELGGRFKVYYESELIKLNKLMIIKRQKTFASAAKIISDKAIKEGVAKEVAKSTEWIKTHPFNPGLLREKTTKRVSLFSEESGEE